MDRSKFRKAIICDCDNTLWKGVLGEDDILPDIAFQNELIFLARRGVIIGLCSKNNEKDVLNELKYQPLEEQYISVHRINWKDKASNLKEIAEELNIGLDAIVFVDDMDFEINLIRAQLPDVMAIYPQELTSVVVDHFDLSGDFTKTQQYKENFQREKAKEQFSNIDEYLKSLDMIIHIDVNNFDHIARVSELTQKTNQFNLTSFRYTEQSIRDFIRYGANVFTLSVKDRFGDNGITGVCIIFQGVIDMFLLSCRILGRGIEYAFLDKIIEYRRDKQYPKELFALYVPSAKNGQTECFYSCAGFRGTERKGTYFVNTHKYKPKAKSHFRYE